MSEVQFTVYKMYTIDKGAGPLKAFVDVCINDVVLIKGLKVIEGQITGGLFVAMPQDQGANKKWYDTARILNKDVRRQLDRIILTYYIRQAHAEDTHCPRCDGPYSVDRRQVVTIGRDCLPAEKQYYSMCEDCACAVQDDLHEQQFSQ